MNNWYTVITFDQPHEAHFARNLLEANGINSIIRDELTVQTCNLYSNTVGGVKLDVKEEDMDSAISILKEGGYIIEGSNNIENEDPKVETIAFISKTDQSLCPYCKSDNIAVNKETNPLLIVLYLILVAGAPIAYLLNNFRIPVLIVMVIALFLLTKTSAHKKYKCFDCNKNWRFKKR